MWAAPAVRRLLVATALVAAVGGLVAAPSGARPVSHRLLTFLRTHGPFAFELAGQGARPRVSAAVAARDAVREVQWRPATATGASLIRIDRREGVPNGTLAWLVAVKPRHPLYNGGRGKRRAAANYVVALIGARDGRLVGDAAGYNPVLAGRSGGSGWSMAELSGPLRPR